MFQGNTMVLHCKHRAISLAPKVIACEVLAHRFPITLHRPLGASGIEAGADEVHPLPGAAYEGSNLIVGEVAGKGMDKDGAGIGTLLQVAVENEYFGQVGEPPKLIHNQSVQFSGSHSAFVVILRK